MATASPPKAPGETLATFFDNFFKIITAIATLGASITFSKVISSPVTPWIDYGFSKTTIQYYLSISWLMFIICLGMVSFFTAALSLWRSSAVEWFGTEDSRKRRVVMYYATFVSIILFGLIIAAFIFLGLVVAAYTGPLGWSAIAFTALAGTLGFGSIIWQSPIGSKTIGGAPNDDELFRKNSEQYGYSPERKSNGYGGRLTGDDSYGNVFDGGYNEKVPTMIKEQYVEDGYGRRGSIRDVSPRFADTPLYTTDLRRMRLIRASSNECEGRR